MAQNDGVYLYLQTYCGKACFFLQYIMSTLLKTRLMENARSMAQQWLYAKEVTLKISCQTSTSVPQIRVAHLEIFLNHLQACWNVPSPLALFKPVYPRFGLFAKNELPIWVRMQDLAWLLGCSLTRAPLDSNQLMETQTNAVSTQGSENQPKKSTDVPV